jgi:hypothetical protein
MIPNTLCLKDLDLILPIVEDLWKRFELFAHSRMILVPFSFNPYFYQASPFFFHFHFFLNEVRNEIFKTGKFNRISESQRFFWIKKAFLQFY